MRWRARALILLVGVAAQPLVAGAGGDRVASTITGLELPPGTRADDGFLTRAAARADLELTAGEVGATLGPRHEVFHLGAIDGATATVATVQALVARQGWTVVPAPTGEPWAWLDKGATRVLMQLVTGDDGAWLYLAEVAGRAPAPSAAAPPPAVTAPPPAARSTGRRAFHFTTTRFDDGWVAEETPDGVRVTKGALTGLLVHAVVMTDEMRPPVRATTDFFWARDVAPRFEVRSTDDRARELQFTGVDYREGAGVDRATGRRAFVAMSVAKANGVATNVVVAAPDRATLEREFPRPQELTRLLGCNRFAVAPADLPGAWAETGGAFAQLYEVQTGNYAGMSAAVSSAQFWFEPDGTYRSLHKGGTGMVGSMKVFQQEYRGRWRLDGDWELTLTNRAEGRSDTFLARFEAVRGGRLLHLIDKAHPGMQYTLATVAPTPR